jgi:hypothetical protein
MKSPQELYDERMNRLKTAIALGKPDRTPIMAWMDSFASVYKGIPMSKFSTKFMVQARAVLSTFLDFPEFDCSEGTFTPPKVIAGAFLSKIKLAGKELPEGSLWQVDEQERLTREDYDTILKIGWKKFKSQYNKRIDLGMPYIIRMIIAGIKAEKEFKKAGLPVFFSPVLNIPFDPLCAGRTIAKFTSDLYKMPDKVQAVMDEIFPVFLDDTRKMIKPGSTFSVFMGCARSASMFLSPKIWERFVWPYIKKGVQMIVDAEAVVNLHFDSNWDRDLERFKELPKGKCVWACDHATDIFKLIKVLDGHMCIKGDVPASLLTVGTPDDVYKYTTKLIKEIGPRGFILAPGCTLPHNAKVDNVKAMLAAATGK